MVSTEAERDELRKRIDDLGAGAQAFETRITDLLTQISDLEAEVARRDAVVLKMAEKYQLVEKDSFGDDLVSAATNKETTEKKS